MFGESVNLVLDTLSKEEAAKKVMVIDSASLTHNMTERSLMDVNR